MLMNKRYNGRLAQRCALPHRLIDIVLFSLLCTNFCLRLSRLLTYNILAQKREKPYGEFVDMVYKVQQNSKNPNSYTEEEMQKDVMKV